ncbi:MAG: Hint domain-containing protein [Butyricicoccus sp.]|nr:Hint domain-containing protein [Butyricicoccus sp.]
MELDDFFDCIQTAASDNPDKDSFAVFQEAQIVALIKTAEDSVRTCFFPNDVKPNMDAALFSAFAELSVKYMCYGIGTLSGSWKDMVQNCAYSVVGDWFKAHDDLGEKLLISYLAAHQLNPATNTELMKAIVKRLCEKEFLLMEITYAQNKMNDQPKMLLAVVRQCAPEQYDAVWKAWSNAFPHDLLQQLTGRPWFGKYQQTDTLFEYHLRKAVENAANLITNSKNHDEYGATYYSGVGLYGSWQVLHHHEYDKGVAVVQWLDNGLAKKYNLRSAKTMQTHFDDVKSEWRSSYPGQAGCVAPDTPIRMADGREKAIRDIGPGEQVLSEGNTVSICSEEHIRNHSITAMYGINQSKPFLSLEHAVKTKRGWCSLHPALSNQINPHFDVQHLQVGDFVQMLCRDESGNLTPEWVRVDEIPVEVRESAPYFEGHDLHFREGRNSYFANGFLCLLNYPEITIQRVMDNLAAMTPENRTAFLTFVQENRDLVGQVFGAAAIHQFLMEVQNVEL